VKTSSSFRISRLLAIILALAWPPRCPIARAVNPPPDGGYPGNNTAEGTGALFHLTTGYWNTAIGATALFNDTTGDSNTACGIDALYSNVTGRSNTAVGSVALGNNSSGSGNTAMGESALAFNRTGDYNTAVGLEALFGQYGSSGSYNTANGFKALRANNSYRNTATGAFAMTANTSGAFNTADGYGALNRNTTGEENAAIGYGALFFNNADHNSAFGTLALLFNTAGTDNCAFGLNALALNSTGSNNIALGSGAGNSLTTGNNNIDIGNTGLAAESNTIRIGTQGVHTAAYVGGIFGAAIMDGAPVLVDTNGHLGTAVSSVRFKNDIKPMDKSSEAILSLKPVTFRYKTDTKGTPQSGLIAEDVAKVNPDLVVHDKEGKPYSVRYDQVNAMLLNEFLKEHRKVEAQQATIAELKSTVAQQQDRFGQQEAQIQALTSGLQKVSAQLEVRNHAPQTVVARNDRGKDALPCTRRPVGDADASHCEAATGD
jgi:trimeric autotransporter adhesin